MPEGKREDGNDANPLHKRLPAQVVGRRRRAEPPPEDGLKTLDRKTVFAMKGEQRAKWLNRVLKLAADGACRPSDLYDIIASSRFADDLPVKVGRKMARAVREQLEVFSVKQQRFLSAEATLLVKFAEAPEPTPAPKEEPQLGAGPGEEAASLTEDMMARCRAFVREKMAERGEGGEGADAQSSAAPPVPEDEAVKPDGDAKAASKHQEGNNSKVREHASRSRDRSRNRKSSARETRDSGRSRGEKASSKKQRAGSSSAEASRRSASSKRSEGRHDRKRKTSKRRSRSASSSRRSRKRRR